MEGGTWDQGKGCCVWQQLVHSSWEGKKNQQCGLVGGRWLRLRFLAEMAPTVSPADTCLCLVLEDIGGDVCWGLERAGGEGSGRSGNTQSQRQGGLGLTSACLSPVFGNLSPQGLKSA